MPTIRLRNVDKTYGGGAANAVSALDLEIGDGEFMCLLGPSGCGKTTTLRMIAGLEHLSGGEIEIGARKVDSVAEGVFVPPEKRDIGLVFQSYALWPHLNIERNTDFGLRVRKVPKAERQERVRKVMQTLGIEQYRHRYPSQLSGGQQQRVALARMLAVNPEVLLLDEPLSNLDARLRLEMRAELKRLHEEFGTTIVFVTHDQWEAMTLATTIAVMREGRLQQVGTPNDIYSRPANRFVAEFVGNPPINIVELGENGGSPLAATMRTYLARHPVGGAGVASVGIRPEAIRIATDVESVPEDALRVPARITGILPTGGSWIVELAAGPERMFQLMHEPAERPAREVGSPAVGVMLDTFHMNMEDPSIPAAIREAGALLFHFQANENHRGFVGSGHIDWPEVARALVAIGYTGPITLEPFRRNDERPGVPLAQWRPPERDEDEDLARSVAHLRAALAFAGRRA